LFDVVTFLVLKELTTEIWEQDILSYFINALISYDLITTYLINIANSTFKLIPIKKQCIPFITKVSNKQHM